MNKTSLWVLVCVVILGIGAITCAVAPVSVLTEVSNNSLLTHAGADALTGMRAGAVESDFGERVVSNSFGDGLVYIPILGN